MGLPAFLMGLLHRRVYTVLTELLFAGCDVYYGFQVNRVHAARKERR